MAVFKNRDSDGYHDPRIPGWDQFHILFPRANVGPNSTSDQKIYLHDYPLSCHEILHFFGFSLELGVKEIWEKNSWPLIPSELMDFPETIDLLGLYQPSERTIIIFEKPIQAAAKRHNWDHAGLREVVRIHEYAHALHHLGCLPSARSRLWEPLSIVKPHDDFILERDCLFDSTTDLDLFFGLRTRWFKGLKTREAEFIAQTCTAVFSDYLETAYGPRLGDNKSIKSIFWELMTSQPPDYKITPFSELSDFWPKARSAFRKTLLRAWESRAQASVPTFPLYLEGHVQNIGRKDFEALLNF